MPQVSVPNTSTTAGPTAARSRSRTLLCTWTEHRDGVAHIDLAGELVLVTASQLRRTLAEAQLQADLVVIDMRRLTFMDCIGMQAILDAARGSRGEGGRVMLVRGPVQVDRVFKLTGADEKVVIFSLAPDDPVGKVGNLDLRRRRRAARLGAGP